MSSNSYYYHYFFVTQRIPIVFWLNVFCGRQRRINLVECALHMLWANEIELYSNSFAQIMCLIRCIHLRTDTRSVYKWNSFHRSINYTKLVWIVSHYNLSEGIIIIITSVSCKLPWNRQLIFRKYCTER